MVLISLCLRLNVCVCDHHLTATEEVLPGQAGSVLSSEPRSLLQRGEATIRDHTNEQAVEGEPGTERRQSQATCVG